MTHSPLVESAGQYLALGLRVIALSGKMPNAKVHRHGLYDFIAGEPETDEDWAVVRAAFEHADTTGIGILTGLPLVVVDIDSDVGAENWANLAGETPADGTWVARTGKGLHLYFGTMVQTGTFKPFGANGGVDLKGDGGYVAAPPSAHPDGGAYEWLWPPTDRLIEAPDALMSMIAQNNFDKERRMTSKAMRRPVRGKRYEEGDHVFYAQVGYDALIDSVREAPEGNRNNMLAWAAMTMAEEGAIDEDFDALTTAAIDSGLTQAEVIATVRSARRSRG